MRPLAPVALGVLGLSAVFAPGATAGQTKPPVKTPPQLAAKVRQQFSVFRTPKKPRDTFKVKHRSKRAAARAMNTRLVGGDGKGLRFYVGLSGSKLCVYVQNDKGGAAGASCSAAADVLSGQINPLLLLLAPKLGWVALLVPDGAHDAYAVTPDGAQRPLQIQNNAIVEQITEGTGIKWTSANGATVTGLPIAP